MHEYWNNPEWWAMLEAIRAGGDDDLPRLVAADWLEDRGHGERAEFIRLQIRMFREGSPRVKPDYHATRRVHALMKRHKVAWIAPLIPVVPKVDKLVGQYTVGVGNATVRVIGKAPGRHGDTAAVRVEFTRGFVRHVAGHSENLCGGHPLSPLGAPSVLTTILQRDPVASVELYDCTPDERRPFRFGYYVAERTGLLVYRHWLPPTFAGTAVDGVTFDTPELAQVTLSGVMIDLHKPKLVESPV